MQYIFFYRAPCLKSLHLLRFDGPNEVLEDLEVSASHVSSGTENLLESVCQACPLLRKHLHLRQRQHLQL
jgi:hypothetical protein